MAIPICKHFTTLTSDSNIFTVSTVMDINTTMKTVKQGCFSASTTKIIKYNAPSALSESSTTTGSSTCQ